MNELIGSALAWAVVSCSPAAACEPPHDFAVSEDSAQAEDPWLGSDKFTHAAVSWAATAFAFGTAHAAGLETDDALIVAVPGALALGIAKELIDSRRTFFSVRDLVADAAGAAAAYFFLREVR